MIEWFKNLDVAWQTAIFGAVVTVSLVIIGWFSGLFKWLLGKIKRFNPAKARRKDERKKKRLI